MVPQLAYKYIWLYKPIKVFKPKNVVRLLDLKLPMAMQSNLAHHLSWSYGNW